ncbi:Uncharacterised protein [Mycobacteroides abscessus subsp. abscessus]|nr:Uncharacterised protein [Mycobacteroides abscessus subsp. abscessus]
MHTGARDLARGEQPGHLGVTVRIGDDTAAAVMRPRHYRDQLDRRIYPGRRARGGDGGKSDRKVTDGAGIEVNTLVSALT